MARAFALYDLCRTKQVVIREVPQSGGKTIDVRIVSIPVGFSFLPYSGGLMDQPAYLADAFHHFMIGERVAAMTQLSK